MHSKKALLIPGFLALFALVAGCQGDPLLTPAPAPVVQPENVAPSVVVHQPAANIQADVGAPIEIRYADEDPDDDAASSVVAVPEGGGTPIPIATARPEKDGAEQTVSWDTTGVAPGRYRIEVLCSDTEEETTVAAAGIVTLNELIPPPPPAWVDGLDAFVRDMAVLADGDVILVGQFFHSATFGEGQPSEVTFINPMSAAFRAEMGFVARYAPSGVLRWVRAISPTLAPARAVIPFSVAAFSDGSFVVAGWASGGTGFNVGLPSEKLLPSASTRFLARYDADGAVVWAEGIQDKYDLNLRSWAPSVESFPDGSCVVADIYNDFAKFRYTRTDESTVDVDPAALLAARYNADGTLADVVSVTAASAADKDALRVDGLAAFPDGSFAVAGWFRTAAKFGTTTLTAADTEGYVARYNADGSLAWAHGTQAAAGEQAKLLAAAAAPGGALLVSGSFETDATLAGTALTGSGTGSMFVTRFEADGTLAWAHTVTNVTESIYDHLACDADGNCVLLGSHEGDAEFWEGALTLSNAFGGTASWTARFLADGTLDWARSDGGGGNLYTAVRIAGLRAGGQPVLAANLDGPFTLDSGLPTELNFTGRRYLVASFSALGLLE